MEFLEVMPAQVEEAATALGSQPESHDTIVDRVRRPPDESRGLGAVDQSDSTVVLEEQGFGNLSDRRPFAIRVALDREEQLMLRRGETGGVGLLLAPVQEATEPGPQLEQSFVVPLGNIRHVLHRATIGIVVPSWKRVPRHAEARRTLLLTMLGVVLGIAGGCAAWLLLHLIGLVTNLALFHRWAWTLPSFRDFHPDGTLVIAAMCGGLIVSLLARWSPVIRGHGIPEAMEAVLVRQSRISPRAALAKPASAAIAIGTGGPFGAEGPIIVTGGALGSLIGQTIRVTPSERKILLACGAAAGMSATFGTPLAAVVLAIELLLFEFSNRALVPLIAASSVAGAMHVAFFGSGPLFHVPSHHYAGLGSLPVFAVLGILCGLLAVVICKGLYLIEAAFRRLPIHEFWHPILGAFVFACIGLAVPRALGVGYDAIDDVLANRLAVGVLIVLLLGKLAAWWVALGSGTSGGTLAPILLISGAFGSLCGALINDVAPGLHLSPGAVALVAMAATFGAATRATFTAVVFAFELTHDFGSILPIMLAAVLADLVAGALLEHGLMTEKLARRGLRVSRDYQPDYLQTVLVGDAMTRDPMVLPNVCTVDEALHALNGSAHSAYPLVDEEHRCVGIVSRRDLLDPDARADMRVLEIASTDVVSVSPGDTLWTALERILDENVEHLPVVDPACRILGICTRTDILRARARDRDAEQIQPGWRRSWRRSQPNPTAP
jgi:CIC family chloride channel protein